MEYESMSENLWGDRDPVQQTWLLELLDQRSHNGSSAVGLCWQVRHSVAAGG